MLQTDSYLPVDASLFGSRLPESQQPFNRVFARSDAAQPESEGEHGIRTVKLVPRSDDLTLIVP